jgi:hypothetical protein
MDVLKEIEQQINSIKKQDGSTYLDSILGHISRAEYYYDCGKEDDRYYNDVIYRSNQAYEGALKESYKVLAQKTTDEVLKKTPNDIEKYFETENIFRDRVLQLFKNYRQEWRNKSTHDYKLIFDESEAFIALTSVTSFIHLLLKEIQEKIFYIKQEKNIEKEKTIIEHAKSIIASKDKSPLNKLVNILVEFSKQRGFEKTSREYGLQEVEVIGLFHAYIEAVGISRMHINRDPSFKVGNKTLRPDFLIKLDGEQIIVEFTKMKKHTQEVIYQVLNYMEAANVSRGIVYNINFHESNPIPHVIETIQVMNNNTYTIMTVS